MITDEMVKAAVDAYDDATLTENYCAHHIPMRAALEAAERARWRPSEEPGTLYQIEFVLKSDEHEADKPAGTYVTLRMDRPDLSWSAGRAALRYLPPEDGQ